MSRVRGVDLVGADASRQADPVRLLVGWPRSLGRRRMAAHDARAARASGRAAARRFARATLAPALGDVPARRRDAEGGPQVKTLGIDPGARTGWALVVDGDVVDSGTWQLTERGDDPGARFWRLRWQLEQVDDDVDVLAYETKFALRGAGTRNLIATGGYIATLQVWAHEVGAHLVELAPSSLKKRAVGYGRASKADMIRHASARAAKTIIDDNEADAIALATVAHDEHETR